MQFLNINTLTLFLFLVIIGVFLFLFLRFFQTRKKIYKIFSKLPHNKYFFLKYIFLLIAFFVLSFSIFGIKLTSYEKNEISGTDVVFVLDVSKSMNVADISEGNRTVTRLDFAKAAMINYVTEHKNHRFGLVIFSGEAISVIPLTMDSELFATLLRNVDYKNLTKQGSNFYDAIELGDKRIEATDEKKGVLVFLSDGGDREDGESISKISSLRRENIVSVVFGVGTENGGKIIQGTSVFGDKVYQKYKGQYVISQKNTENLKNIASGLGGEYKNLEKVSDINTFDNTINTLESSTVLTSDISRMVSFSRVLAIISFLLFVVFLVLLLFEKNNIKLK